MSTSSIQSLGPPASPRRGQRQPTWLLAVAGLTLALLPGRPAAADDQCPVPGEQAWLEQQMLKRETLLDEERERAIVLLKEFLKRHPAAPQRADALFRLAELQWERAEQKLLKQMRAYESELDAFRAGKRKQRPPEPSIDLRNSIEVYEEILEQHSEFARTDTVLYLYGFGLNEQGDETAALSIFKVLLKRFPHSAFVPDAHLAIGEHHFAKGRFPAARKSYGRVLEHIDSPLYDLALYKTAWCFFKEGDAKSAAENFKRVLARARERKESGKASRLATPSADLEREALEDLAFTFSEYGGAKEAYRFMRQVGGEEYSIRVLKRLGQVFFRQARYDQAIESYRMMVERFPLAEENPQHQARIAEANQRAGHIEKSLHERRLLAERYGPGSSWYENHKDKPELVAKAVSLAESSLRLVALYRHKQAQTSKDDKAYRRAERSYNDYLAAFPNTEQAATIHFYLGEVLFKLSSFEQAAEHYGKAAQALGDVEKKKDAAYAAVLAFDKLRKSKPLPDKPSQKAEPLTSGEQGFTDAVQAFAELAPDDAKLAQLRFEVGRLHYLHGQFDVASKKLLALVNEKPEDEFAEAAADLALDCFTRSRSWSELEEWARTFQKKGWFAKRPLGNQLQGFITASIFQRAKDQAAENKHREAAEQYQRLASEFANDPLAPKALFNAAVSLEKAGEKKQAIDLYESIVTRYPQTAADAMYVIAGIYASQYDYSSAAHHYSRFAKEFPSDPRAPDCLLEAALLYRAQGGYQEEAAALDLFIGAYPKHERAAEAKLMQAAALGKAGDYRAAESVLRDYLKRDASRQNRVRETNLHLGLALLRQGKGRLARKQFERCGGVGRRAAAPTGLELAAAAECRFELGELIFAEYQGIALKPPMKRLVDLLRKKAAKLKQAEALFTKVVELGHMEWGSAALYRIGDMYAQFAQAIYKAPLPKDLSEQELDVYRQELQSLAYPIEDKALSAFTLSHEVAKKHGYLSTWSQKTIEMLRKLDPAQFPREEELRPKTRWADSFTAFGLELKVLPVPKASPAASAKKTAGGER